MYNKLSISQTNKTIFVPFNVCYCCCYCIKCIILYKTIMNKYYTDIIEHPYHIGECAVCWLDVTINTVERGNDCSNRSVNGEFQVRRQNGALWDLVDVNHCDLNLSRRAELNQCVFCLLWRHIQNSVLAFIFRSFRICESVTCLF